MKSKVKCEFNLFEETHSEEEFNNITKHLMHCPDCTDLYFKFSQTLSVLSFQQRLNSPSNPEFDQANYLKVMEKWGDISNENINEFITDYSQQNNFAKYQNKPTPEYLKTLVFNELKKENQTKLDRIILKIHNKIEVIGSYIDNLIVNSNAFDMVATRGDSKTRKGNVGAVEFFQKFDEDEVIQYHVIQDGPDSVLLTIKMENFSSEPVFLGLRSNNKLLSTKPVEMHIANFPKLGPGDYQIEASFEDHKKPIFIPITIVT